MKNILFKLSLMLVIVLSFTSCREKVPPGHKGILISTAGGDKGKVEVCEVGYTWVGFYQELYLYPVFIQNTTWAKDEIKDGTRVDESISFQSSEGLEFSGDFGMTYQIYPDSVKFLFGKYRCGIQEITDVFLRNEVRDALVTEASKMPADVISGAGKEELIDKVQARVKATIQGTGIRVDKISAIGKFRVPESVRMATESKINATQRAMEAENKLRQTEAEAKAQVITAKAEGEAELAKARAQAEANLLISKSITETLIRWELAKKWDGKSPQVTGSNGVILDLK